MNFSIGRLTMTKWVIGAYERMKSAVSRAICLQYENALVLSPWKLGALKSLTDSLKLLSTKFNSLYVRPTCNT